MADWPMTADGQRYTGFVTTQSGVSGTAVALPPVTQTKLVTFTTIIASTTTDASGIFIAIPTQTGAAARYFVDVAVGAAGFETVIIPNLYLAYPAAARAGQEVFFPITIPSGTRISARIQSTLNLTAGLQINVRLMASGLLVTPARSVVTTWGDTTATTNGTIIPVPAAINAYGALVELKVTPYTSGGTYSAAVLATSPANLVAYWRMGEASGDLVDAINGNTMVATGTAMTYSATGAINGDSDTAISFPGKVTDGTAATDYFTAANTAPLLVGDVMSVAAWVKVTNQITNNRIITQGLNGYDLAILGPGKLGFAKDGQVVIATSTPSITTGVYHMVVATKNGATTHLYIDGVDVAFTGANATLVAAAGSTSIGRNQVLFGSAFAGSIDEVALWNAPITTPQVATLYNTGLKYIPGTPATNPYPVEEIIVNLQTTGVASNNSRGMLSILIGATGLEQEIMNLPILANSAVLTFGQNFLGPFPCHIPAGTQVWGKLQWSSLTAPVPVVEVTIYGVS